MIMMLLIQAAAEVPPAQEGISGGALAFMLVCMAAVTALAGWCFSRVLRGRRHFDPDGTGPEHSPVSGRVED